MGTLNLLQNAKKNPWSIVILIGLAAIVVWALYDEIHDMRQAATDYDYCYHLSYLYEIICKTVFACLYLIMTYLTYINKQFSRWSIWLFYVSAIALVLHFMIAGYMFDYVYAHVDADHLDKLPSLARTIFCSPAYFIILCLFFVPKFIKDTMKLKEEQELTI
jgi:hypothetical protein